MFDDLIELLRKVAQGDNDALEKSEMEKVTVGKPLSVNLSTRELQGEHYRTSMVKTSCEILGLDTMAQVCQKLIDVLNVCSRKFHNVTLEPLTFEPEDYAETMQHLVFELKEKLIPLAQKFSEEPLPDTSRNVIHTATEASTSSDLGEAGLTRPPASKSLCDKTGEAEPSRPAASKSVCDKTGEAEPSRPPASQPPSDSVDKPGPSRPKKSMEEKSVSQKAHKKAGYTTKRGSAPCVSKR